MDELQARWGWPCGHSEEEDARVLAFMEEVVQITWDIRYPDNVQRRAAAARLQEHEDEEELAERARGALQEAEASEVRKESERSREEDEGGEAEFAGAAMG